MSWLEKMWSKVTGTEKVKVRARNKKGHYVADDKSTPNVNEAYKDGRTPTKRKKAAPKAAPKKRGRPKGSKNKAK